MPSAVAIENPVVVRQYLRRSSNALMRRVTRGGTRDEDRRELPPRQHNSRLESDDCAMPARPPWLNHRECLAPGSREDDLGCTSRQRNTHSTESRQVRYPWHPWCGRSVTVYEALSKGGHRVCRCGFDDQRNDRSLEVPTWMFEPATCDHLRLISRAAPDCAADRR